MFKKRIKELDSAIINIRDNKMLIKSFFSSDMLLEHLSTGNNNIMSTGAYDYIDFDILTIKDNVLVIIKNNGIETNRYLFEVLLNEETKLKVDGKFVNRVIKIRRCKFNLFYHYLDLENNISFNTLSELKEFLSNKYDYILEMG